MSIIIIISSSIIVIIITITITIIIIIIIIIGSSRTKTASAIPRGVSRGKSSCFSPLPSRSISRMAYHARQRAAEFRGKMQGLRLRQIVTT